MSSWSSCVSSVDCKCVISTREKLCNCFSSGENWSDSSARTDWSKFTFPEHGTDTQLVSINRKENYKLVFEDWKAQFEASNTILDRNLSRCNTSTADLYQILGLFFVFEGVIITAVSQSTNLKCHNWIFFCLLLLLAFLGTVGASVQKLSEIEKSYRRYVRDKEICQGYHNAIEKLKEQGINCKLAEIWPKIPAHAHWLDPPPTGLFRGLVKDKQAVAVLGLVISFSIVTLVATRIIICGTP